MDLFSEDDWSLWCDLIIQFSNFQPPNNLFDHIGIDYVPLMYVNISWEEHGITNRENL